MSPLGPFAPRPPAGPDVGAGAIPGLPGAPVRTPVRDGEAPTDMAVKAHCRQRLAGYKIPKQVTFVADLPRTASGKIRRAALKGSTDEQA